MLLKRVEVRASLEAHGRGLFAGEVIRRGECWWRFDRDDCAAWGEAGAWEEAERLEVRQGAARRAQVLEPQNTQRPAVCMYSSQGLGRPKIDEKLEARAQSCSQLRSLCCCHGSESEPEVARQA